MNKELLECVEIRGKGLSTLSVPPPTLDKIRITEIPGGIKFGKVYKNGYITVFEMEDKYRVKSIKLLRFSDHFKIEGSKILRK